MSNDELGNLEAKIKKTRDESTIIDKPAPEKSAYAEAMRAGTDVLAGTAVGGFIGYFLDKMLETGSVFLIVCVLLGFAGGLINAVRQVMRGIGKDTNI